MFIKLLVRTAMVTSLSYKIALTSILLIQLVKSARKK